MREEKASSKGVLHVNNSSGIYIYIEREREREMCVSSKLKCMGCVNDRAAVGERIASLTLRWSGTPNASLATLIFNSIKMSSVPCTTKRQS